MGGASVAQERTQRGTGCWGCSHSDNLLLPLSALSLGEVLGKEVTVASRGLDAKVHSTVCVV